NGKPQLINSLMDEDSGEVYFKYDESEYTTEMPPSDLFEPIYYKDEQWYGISKEEWLESLPEEEPDVPNSKDLLNAQLLANDLEHNSKIEDLQQDIANLTAELLKVQGGMTDVRDS
ncbi:hypothetical protein, partial [Staphylococcus nepalensis]